MARRAVQSESEVCAVLLETYGANDGMNQLLLEHLDARAWRASPEGKNKREGRTIAGIFAHLHNNRVSWIKNSAPHLKCPAPLDPARCTIKQTRAAHRQSAAPCLEMLKETPSNGTPKRVTRILMRALGAQLACGNNDAQLHVHARGPSSGAGDHASTSTGLQAARQGHVWDLMGGEVSEAVRL